jgi:hypothetical protein
MKILIILLTNLFLYSANSMAAQNTNGCGTDRFGWLVPDGTLLSGCTFKNACNKHDICYGRCLAEGDLVGQETCNNKAERDTRRSNCDVSLKKNIIADNNNYICSLYASIYSWAVITYGEPNFFGLDGNQPSHIKQLNRFFKFVEENPNSFNLIEIEKLFKKISGTTNKTDIVLVEFEKNIPRISIISIDDNGSKVLLEVEGRKQ